MTLLKFVCFLLLGVPMFAHAKMYPSIRTCLTLSNVQCPCGSTGQMVASMTEDCLMVDAEHAAGNCEPCDPRLFPAVDPCRNFSMCATCDPMTGSCSSCPPGSAGRFCEMPNGMESGPYGNEFGGYPSEMDINHLGYHNEPAQAEQLYGAAGPQGGIPSGGYYEIPQSYMAGLREPVGDTYYGGGGSLDYSNLGPKPDGYSDYSGGMSKLQDGYPDFSNSMSKLEGYPEMSGGMSKPQGYPEFSGGMPKQQGSYPEFSNGMSKRQEGYQDFANGMSKQQGYPDFSDSMSKLQEGYPEFSNNMPKLEGYPDFSMSKRQEYPEYPGSMAKQDDAYYAGGAGVPSYPSGMAKRDVPDDLMAEDDMELAGDIIPPVSIFRKEKHIRTRDKRAGDGFGRFPLEVVIPAGESISKNRYVRSASECFFPDHMDTAEIRCTIWPTYTKCNVTCIWGHTLSAGRTVTIKCRNRENTWKPYGFKECDPYVDCSLKLKSPGSVNCVYNRLNDPIDCDIMCNEYDDIPEVPKNTYACTLAGAFTPILPFCVEKANTTITVPPPAWR